MPRGDQPERQWRLLHLLAASGGRTIPELQHEVGCSRRTLWRDLAVLQAAGFPLTTEPDGRENRYRLIEGTRGLPPIPFTLTELASLHLARHLLVPLRGTPLGEPIHSALEKIAATLRGGCGRDPARSIGPRRDSRRRREGAKAESRNPGQLSSPRRKRAR